MYNPLSLSTNEHIVISQDVDQSIIDLQHLEQEVESGRNQSEEVKQEADALLESAQQLQASTDEVPVQELRGK